MDHWLPGDDKQPFEGKPDLEVIYFTIAAIALYVVSDWILHRIEIRLGKRLEHRSLVFFGIILTLALTSFWLIRSLTAS